MRSHANFTLKTLGRHAARLLMELHDRDKTVFTHSDVEKITGQTLKSARNFVGNLVNRGVVTRLKPGLFILVPFEMGHEREFLGNPYVVAREMVAGSNYYISHASAMDIHQIVTQPQFVVYATTPKALRSRDVLGTEFRFVKCKSGHLFGVIDHWVTKTEKVRVSDLERTVIDGLKQSEYCGGFTEVAKAYWMRREDIVPEKIVDYALRINIGAVIRRIGFLLEMFGVDAPLQIDRLRERLTPSYAILDPLLPAEGTYNARWRLLLNIDPVEIVSIIHT